MRLVTDDVMVTVCAWWDGPRTRELVDRQLDEDAALVRGRRWIWVYHGPPDGSPTSWTGTRHYGDEELGAWIERHGPDIVVCGHVHESPFAPDGSWIDRIGSTLVLNAGRQLGPVPTSIELDTDTGTVRWSSVEGVEERSLAGA
jgi:Icc-related predicted phosphoesterase